MNYWKLLWLLVLWLILVAIPDSVSISYFFLFVVLWSVSYLRYVNRKELKKKTGFLQTSLKILTFFFFFVLLLTSLTIPEAKRNIPTKEKIAPQEKTSELLPQEDSSIKPSQAPEVQNLQRVQKQSTESIEQKPIETSVFENYSLIKVVDWDTITIKDNNWKKIKVRMIWLDTPESSSTRYGYIECYWVEASQHLKSLLQGANQIQLEADQSQTATDKYGRLLWYVRYNGINLNQKMIEDGYGFEYTYNLPYKYQSEFKYAQKTASEKRLWLWNDSACNGERKALESQKSIPVKQIVAPQKQSTSSQKIYHTWKRGWCYYYNNQWKKEYVNHSFCK